MAAQPALTPAPPASVVPGSTRAGRHQAVDVLMTDGSWQYASVRAWARDRSGEWRVQLAWYGLDADGRSAQFETWYLFDEDRVKRA